MNDRMDRMDSIREQIKKWVKLHHQNIQLVMDESDEISNPDTVRTKAALSCFRRCKAKVLTTGTSTRTFEEVSGKDIRRIHQVPLTFSAEERDAYNIVMKEFLTIQRNYFGSTGNYRKDAMLRLMQQITLMLRVSAAPNTLNEYVGDTPVKIMAAVDMAAQWENEYVVIGVRHKAVLDKYAEAIKEFLPDRPLFIVTGSTTTFAQRRKLRKTLKESGNGILLWRRKKSICL